MRVYAQISARLTAADRERIFAVLIELRDLAYATARDTFNGGDSTRLYAEFKRLDKAAKALVTLSGD